MRKAGVKFKKQFSVWRKNAEMPGHSDARFEQRWQEAKTQQFTNVTSAGTHALAIVIAALVLFTDVLERLFSAGTNDFPGFVIYIGASYSCLLLNLATLGCVTTRRIECFYIGFMFIIINSVLYIETGPTFFILRGNDALAQGVLALVVLDIRRSSVGGAIYTICCGVGYMRNASAFKQDLLFEKHAQLFMSWQVALWALSCGGAYAAEYWLKNSIKANLETENVQEAMRRVLSALCEAVVHLDTDLHIQSPSQTLLHMLAPHAGGDAPALQDKEFMSFIPSMEDRARFLEFTSFSSIGGCTALSGSPAAAVHVQLRDTRGNLFHVELFHTHLQGRAALVHLIGIRYSETTDERSAEGPLHDTCCNLPTFSRNLSCPSDQACNTPEPSIGPLRDDAHAGSHPRAELESTLGARTDGGRTAVTLAQDVWRCPRCRATRQDWGDTMSVISGASILEEVGSVSLNAAPPPRGDAPPLAPHVEQMDLQQVSQHFTRLYEWAPEMCREVLRDSSATYGVLQRASSGLLEVQRTQYIREVQAQMVELLLVGLKMEHVWPGLSPMWLRITSFVTGAQAVPLRGLMQLFGPRVTDAAPAQMVAWQMPRCNATSISPSWFEQAPQEVYSRVRSEVLSRVAMIDTQALRRGMPTRPP